MADQWYYAKGGQRQGPVPEEELQRLAASGELQSSDYVWKEGMSQWTAASSVVGLFEGPTAHRHCSTPQPPPLPTGSADSQSDFSHPTNVSQPAVRPFGDWYRVGWLAHKPLAVQVIVWLLYGFLWIPYWYFWTATPPGSLRGKWASLGRGRQVAFVALTCVLCLSLAKASHERGADTSPSGNLPSAAVANATRAPTNSTNLQSNGQSRQQKHESGGGQPMSEEHSKLAAFRQVIAKFEQAPGQYAGDTERRQYNEELEDLISKFDAVPFDVEKNTDDAKAICKLFEQKLDGRYTGLLYNEIDATVRVMYSELLRR